MKIPVSEPFTGSKEVEYVTEAVKTGWVSGLKGKFLDKFEEGFSKFCDMKYGIACSSGTASLQLATRALDIGPGDEVIVPTFTNIASILCIYYNGATPILADADPETWSMSTDGLSELITTKTKAILPVHIYGHPVEMKEVTKIAKENKLSIIEDCAEAHGAEVDGKKVGSFSDVSCFSFYANKIISTGEGGMTLTNDPEIARKLKQLTSLAFSENNRYEHEFLAYNYRLSNVLAAIGLAQFEQIDSLIEKKRWIAKQYNKKLKDIEGIIMPVEKSWAKNVYWMYGIVLNEKFRLTRDELMKFLSENEIESRAFFVPMHQQHVFHEKNMFQEMSLPISENLGKNGLYLPCSVNITEKQIDFVCDIIKKAS